MLQVFFYISSAKLNLSTFDGDQASLIKSLRSAHRSLRFQPLSDERKVTVEGPFAAVRALRKDLIRRARHLKPTAPTSTVKLRESSPNPRVISHHEFVGPVSCSDSKAKREAAGSNGLSALLQSTGEGSEVQSQLSNAKTPNSARQKVQSFCDTDTDEEEELKAGSRLKLTTVYGTERAKAKPRQLYSEEMNAGVRSSLSGLHRHATEKVSTKKPPVNGFKQKHTGRDRISATESRTYLDSYNSSTDYLKESHQRTSSVAAKTVLYDVSVSSENSARKTEDLSAGGLKDPEDTCIWVDSYIFTYIEKLDNQYDRCLRGLNVSVEKAKGSDLVQICLTERQPSKGSSRVQQALEDLKVLVEYWQSTLRVHEIRYNKKEHPKQKLIQICDDVKDRHMYNDVLYMVEDSRIKVVGPSSPSYLFYILVQHRLQSNTLLEIPVNIH